MTRKKKLILVENDLLIGGGVEKILYSLTDYLQKQGHIVLLVTSERAYEQFEREYPKGVFYYSTKVPHVDAKKYSLKWLLQKIHRRCHWCVAQIIRKVYFDIAIAMKEGECVQHISMIRAKRKYAWIHIDYKGLYYTKYIFGSPEKERECLAAFDRVICVSQSVANSLREVIGDTENLIVCYNPINYREIRQKAEIICSMTKPKDKVLFVAVGRLAKEKRFDLLIDACIELSREYTFELWIIGEGNQREALEKKVKDADLECVKLLGEKNNPYPYIKQADYIVSSSSTESYGLVLQEALILGVPVIATECAAIRETIDERFGDIVTNDLTGIESGMLNALKNPELNNIYRTNIIELFQCESMWTDRLRKIESVMNLSSHGE